MASISENLKEVRERIAEAARKSGRRLEDVRLVAVTKGKPAAAVVEAARAGARIFGENYVQEAVEKMALVEAEIGRGEASWHFIGSLQRNKVKHIVDKVAMIESVDRIELAQEISKRAVQRGVTVEVLVEVNLGGEDTKSGTEEEELDPLLREVAGLQGVRLRGLMAIPPMAADPEETRPYFRRLADLAAGMRGRGIDLPEISMGMSADFEAAIEEGATIVRVGTAIFGPR